MLRSLYTGSLATFTITILVLSLVNPILTEEKDVKESKNMYKNVTTKKINSK